MIFKILAIVAVLFLVYLVFFKKGREESLKKKSGKYDEITDTLVECPKCGVYVSKEEGILSNGNYFCSKECLK